MNRQTVKYALAAAPLLFALSCGLHHASVNDPLPADQLALVLQQSFQSADSSARDTVRKIVEETQQHEIPAAYKDIKELSAQPNLTMDQRITAIRASHTIGQQLQEAVQNGDQQAAEAIHSYNSTH